MFAVLNVVHAQPCIAHRGHMNPSRKNSGRPPDEGAAPTRYRANQKSQLVSGR
jgi:hypothetical protein